jgi:hypothetical protein
MEQFVLSTERLKKRGLKSPTKSGRYAIKQNTSSLYIDWRIWI